MLAFSAPSTVLPVLSERDEDMLDRSGTPLCADFSMFYVAGQIVWDGAGEQLYDQA